MTNLFLLKISKRGIRCRVSANGVPLRSCRDGQPFETADPINVWIKPNLNRLEVQLQTAEPLAYRADRPTFHVSVKQIEQGQGSNKGATTSLSYDLPDDVLFDQPDAEFSKTLEWLVPAPPPSELWAALTTIHLTSTARVEIQQTVQRLHYALATRDLAACSRLLGAKAIDVARCYGFPEQQALPQQETFLRDLMQAPGWTMGAFRAESLVCQLVADDQLVWVTGPDGAPALRSMRNGSGATLILPVYVARIRGSWVVVR